VSKEKEFETMHKMYNLLIFLLAMTNRSKILTHRILYCKCKLFILEGRYVFMEEFGVVVKHFCDLCGLELEKGITELTVQAGKEYTFHLCAKCVDNVSITDLVSDLVTKYAKLKNETLINTDRPLMKITISPSFNLQQIIENKLGYELGRKVLSFKKQE